MALAYIFIGAYAGLWLYVIGKIVIAILRDMLEDFEKARKRKRQRNNEKNEKNEGAD